MQYFSRLATMTCGRSNSVLSSIAYNHNRTLPLCVRDFSSTIDPAVHSEAPEGIDADEATKAAAAQLQRPKTEDEGINYKSVKPATQGGSKLESSGVNPRIDPFTQQKRRHFSQQLSTSSRGAGVPPPPLPSLEDVSCVGLDGTPLPMEEEEEEQSKDEEQREYYKYHKPSPITEIEMVDTRKPITRATDGGASESYYGGGDDVVVWTEEQLDTAEEALRRATLIWKESAMRGDPDSPQSRALLRALLEERRGVPLP